MKSNSFSRSQRSARRSVHLKIVLLLTFGLVVFATGQLHAKKVKPKPESTDNQKLLGEVMRYLPDDCQAIGWIDLAAIRQSQIWKKTAGQKVGLLKTFVELQDNEDVKIYKNIEWAGYGVASQKKQQAISPPLIVNQPIDVPDYRVFGYLKCKQPARELVLQCIAKDQGWTKERIGKYEIWTKKANPDQAICALDDRAVIAGDLALVRKALRRKQPAKLSPNLMRAVKQLDPKAHMALAVWPFAGNEDACDAFPKYTRDLIQRIDGFNVEMTLDKDLMVRLIAVCRDSDTAKELKGIFTIGMICLESYGSQIVDNPEYAQLMSAWDFAIEDRLAIAKIAIPPETLMAATEVKVSSTPSSPMVVTIPIDTMPQPPESATLPTQCVPQAVGEVGPCTSTPTLVVNPSQPTYDPYAPPVPCIQAKDNIPCYPTTPYTPPPYGSGTYTPSPYVCGPKPTYEPTILPIEDIVRLTEAGVEAPIIMEHLGKHRLAAALTTDDLIMLVKKKVDTQVILTAQQMSVAPPGPAVTCY